MAETLAEQIPHMAVIERIVYDPAVFPVFDHPQGAEQPKLVGNGRFGGPEESGDIADAELFEGKGVENPDPGGVAKHPEGFGKPEKDSFGLHAFPDGRDLCLVDQGDGADVVVGHGLPP
jgi:hypothetical protein